MADPRVLPLDGRTRRWEHVPPVRFCSSCRGTLPADEDGACSTCGVGTPPGLPRATRIPEIGYMVLDEVHTFTEGQMAEAAAPLAGKPSTWWERFARWPHG